MRLLVAHNVQGYRRPWKCACLGRLMLDLRVIEIHSYRERRRVRRLVRRSFSRRPSGTNYLRPSATASSSARLQGHYLVDGQKWSMRIQMMPMDHLL